MFKKVLISVSLLVGLIILCGIVLGIIANKRLSEILGDRISVESVDVNILTRSVEFVRPAFWLDSATNSSHIQLYAKAKSISIQSFDVWDLIFNEKIRVRRFLIDSLHTRVLIPDEVDDSGHKDEINLFIKDVFNSIEVAEFSLEKMSADICKTDSGNHWLQLYDFNLTARKIRVDTLTVDKVFPIDFEESEIYLDSFSLALNDGYQLSAKDLSILDTTLLLRKIHLESNYSRSQFAEVFPYEKVQLALDIDGLKATNVLWDIDKGELLELHSDKIELTTPRIKAFRDKRLSQPPLEVKPLLADLIKSIPINLEIDTLTGLAGQIRYDQMPEGYPYSGYLLFDELYFSFYNLTNSPEAIERNPFTQMDILCKFMNQSRLDVNISLDINSNDWTAKGGLQEDFELSSINRLLAGIGGAKAEGLVKRLGFDIVGNNYRSIGSVVFEYSDMKIEVLDENQDKEVFKSLFGNLVLRNNNTRDEQIGYKEGEVYFVRYENKGFWNFLGFSVIDGLKDVAIPFYRSQDIDLPRDEKKWKQD